jgi:CRP/FNR family cyclic AMP-dependent transcriptional regulator
MADDSTLFPSGAGVRPAALGLTTLRKADLLRGVEVFSQATVDELYRLAGLARVVEFAPGAVIFGENDIGDTFYVLVEGSAELTSETKKARQAVGPGEAVGLYSVLAREPRCATATVLEPTTALAITGEDLYTLLSNNMEIIVSMFKHFITKLGLGARV